MSVLQSTDWLYDIGRDHGNDPPRPKSAGRQQNRLQNPKPLRSPSSVADLIRFARNPLEHVGEAVDEWYGRGSKAERARKQSLEDQKQLHYVKMRTATTYPEWEAAARVLDELEGNNEWKSIFESSDYNAPLVEARLKQLDEARISCDIGRMLYLIRTSLTRDLGDMGNLRMYKHSHVGTKDLVEKYIISALDTLNALLDVSAKAKCDAMESKYILEQLLSSRQAFGRSALLLSGGANFGMNHIGVLKSLWEARLLPRIISGASAGSIVGAVVCTRKDEEMPHLLLTFCDGDLAVFDEEGNEDGLLRKAARFLKHGALYDISHLTRVMRELLGELTFQEAYNRTRKILNICVSSASLFELPRLLNYITAPNVLIWSAVAASCSVPFVYTAASLLAKDPKTGEAVPWNPSPQRWIDGSVDNDIPTTRLAEMFNVNHFIVSQVNPHVVPFLVKEEEGIAKEALDATSTIHSGPTWLGSLSHLAKAEALHRMHTLSELGILPNLLTKTVSVLSQKYSGDITIFPEILYSDFPRMLSNPTREFMHQAMLSGERATWPKMSIIKNHCAIELALDDAVQKLRARVVFSPSEVELRMVTRKQKAAAVPKAVRRRTSKKRPVSQNSAPEPAFARSPSLHTHQNRLGRVTPSLRHKKSLSINTVLLEPSGPMLTDDASMNEPNLSYPLGSYPQDVTSSGAEETSNIASSSSSTSLSCPSPVDPPSSPGRPQQKWHRSLFGSSSQPATPSGISKSNLDSDSRPALEFIMTPNNGPSVEPKYERLFHPRTHGQSKAKLLGRHRDSPASPDQSGTESSKSTRKPWGMESTSQPHQKA